MPEGNCIAVRDQINILGCTRKTFSRLTGFSERHVYRLQKQSVSPRSRSLRVLGRMEELCLTLMDIFGTDEKKARQWLSKPNEALGKVSPLEHILAAPSREEGLGQIIDLLKGFKLGIAS